MIQLKCKTCGRHYGEVEMIVGELICPNTSCKAGNQYKILSNAPDDYISYKFMSSPKPSKKDMIKDETS